MAGSLQVRVINIPDIATLADARQVISQQLQALQQNIANQLPLTDFGGSRVQNIGSPQEINDAVTLGYLRQLFVAQGQQPSAPGVVGQINLTAPVEFTVAGSPIINGNGTITLAKAVEAPHFFWAGGTGTATGTPTFRAVVSSDLPVATSTSSGIVEVDGTSIVVSTAAIITAKGPTVQGVVTGSRVLGTVYQNTNATAMVVTVSMNMATGDTASAYTDTSATPTTVVAQLNYGDPAGGIMAMTFVVLPGSYYKVAVVGGAGSIKQVWTEWH